MSAVMNICEAELQTFIRQGLICFFSPQDEIKKGILTQQRSSPLSKYLRMCTCLSWTVSVPSTTVYRLHKRNSVCLSHQGCIE